MPFRYSYRAGFSGGYPSRRREAKEPAGKPATLARPLVGRTNPRRSLMVVVLPAPFGPRSPKISPRRTSIERSMTARTFRPQNPTRKVFERCSAAMIAFSIGAHVYSPAPPAATNGKPRDDGVERSSHLLRQKTSVD